MGKIRSSGPVKIITGLIFNDAAIFDKAASLLTKRLGPIDIESAPFLFTHTHYYNDEMGGGLKRKFLSFEKLKDPENLYKLKIISNKLEERFSQAGSRRINIDPGYLALGKLILLTTKDHCHRVYLKNGVYAETTLFFKDKSYHPREWTYPDYREAAYRGFFNRVREKYIKDLESLQ